MDEHLSAPFSQAIDRTEYEPGARRCILAESPFSRQGQHSLLHRIEDFQSESVSYPGTKH
jgi:hypothetical protein